MNEEVESLMLEHLRAIRQDVSVLKTDVHDLKVRQTAVEEGSAGVHRRLDRLDARAERIEARRGLVEA